MALLSQLADRAQNAINDAAAGTWSQTIIEEWICEAIRDYNLYFRRTTSTAEEIATAASTYTLSHMVREILHVEYPTGDDPPTYLTRKSRYAEDFYDADDNFDFEPVNEYGEVKGTGGTSPYLVFSFTLTIGETITVLARSIHNPELGSLHVVTVPDEHQHMLILFVVWKAHAERAVTEAQNPDTTIRMIQQMAQAAHMAEQDYRRAMKLAQRMAGFGGWTTPWRIDSHDRIY